MEMVISLFFFLMMRGIWEEGGNHTASTDRTNRAQKKQEGALGIEKRSGGETGLRGQGYENK